ncbi:MAG: hypothetical protein ACP5G8_10005, partial [Athalassotoga sp.]
LFNVSQGEGGNPLTHQLHDGKIGTDIGKVGRYTAKKLTETRIEEIERNSIGSPEEYEGVNEINYYEGAVNLMESPFMENDDLGN